MDNFEKNFDNDNSQKINPQLQTKTEILPKENQQLSELAKETGVSKSVYQILYGLYKQAQIVNRIDDFINLAKQPGFELMIKKVRDENLPVTEILKLIGSKSAGEIAKEEENFKKLMGNEERG